MDMDNDVMYIYPKYRWKGEIRRHITSVYICMKCIIYLCKKIKKNNFDNFPPPPPLLG